MSRAATLILINFSDVAFDRESIAGDGVANSFDVLRHSGNTRTVNVGADGTVMVSIAPAQGNTTTIQYSFQMK